MQFLNLSLESYWFSTLSTNDAMTWKESMNLRSLIDKGMRFSYELGIASIFVFPRLLLISNA